MSDEEKIYDSRGKFLGTFRPSKEGSDSSGGGCLSLLIGIVLVIYLILEGWSGIVKPTYSFAPADGGDTELLVKTMSFEKGRFFDTDKVEGHFLVSVSDYDTLYFTGRWNEKLAIRIEDHDFKYNTFKSGEEMSIVWDDEGVLIENKNPRSNQFGELERWEGGMDLVQLCMAVILVSIVLWFLKKIFF